MEQAAVMVEATVVETAVVETAVVAVMVEAVVANNTWEIRIYLERQNISFYFWFWSGVYFCCSIRAVYPKRIKTDAMDSFDVMKEELLRQCLIREIGCNNSNLHYQKEHKWNCCKGLMQIDCILSDYDDFWSIVPNQPERRVMTLPHCQISDKSRIWSSFNN